MSVFALDSNIISFYLKGNTSVIENIEKAINTDNIKHFQNITDLHTVNWESQD